MHKIFKINELIALVLSHLQSDRATLSCVARTSKLLKAAVLPLLWKDLPSVLPLLRLLPTDAVTCTLDSESGGWFIVS
jgi:hypothetical protein